MSTTHPIDFVETYLAEVRDRLADLPDDERSELLEDVAEHLREVAEEHGADHLRERLGSAVQFADELRSSAGYPPFGENPASAPPKVRFRQLRALKARLLTPRLEDALRKLEPGWWFVRGVLVGYVVFFVAGVQRELVPRVGHSRLLGFVVLVAAGAASFVLGDRRPSTQSVRLRRLRIAGEVAVVVFALTYVTDASQAHVVYYDKGAVANPERNPCLTDSAGRPIGNLFAYDASGQLIPQFFLVDQAGRPIDNLCPDQVLTRQGFPLETTYAHDVNGSPVYNVFPRAQKVPTVDPATNQLMGTAPVPPPAVVFPQVAPPTAESSTSTTVPEQPSP